MLQNLDTAVFFFINKHLANPVFDVLMPLVTRMGSGDGAFAAALIIIILCKKEKKGSGVLILAGSALSYHLVVFLKDLIARPRPYMAMPDVRLLVPVDGFLAMPSGHATTAWMTAMVLAGFFKKRVLWFSLAALISFSRVYVGVHYPSDVLAGALVGAVMGYGLLKFAEYTHMT
jgi:undecaprenyl-diphosphatase